MLYLNDYEELHGTVDEPLVLPPPTNDRQFFFAHATWPSIPYDDDIQGRMIGISIGIDYKLLNSAIWFSQLRFYTPSVMRAFESFPIHSLVSPKKPFSLIVVVGDSVDSYESSGILFRGCKFMCAKSNISISKQDGIFFVGPHLLYENHSKVVLK